MAGIRDLCHRGLVGWAMGETADAELVVDALTMALSRTVPDLDGLFHHSDKGSQYTSLDCCAAADLSGLQVSFGSTGDDNVDMKPKPKRPFGYAVKVIRLARGSRSAVRATRPGCHLVDARTQR